MINKIISFSKLKIQKQNNNSKMQTRSMTNATRVNRIQANPIDVLPRVRVPRVRVIHLLWWKIYIPFTSITNVIAFI